MQFINSAEDWYLPEHAPQVIITEKKNVTVYNISDLHADAEINKQWVLSKCSPKAGERHTSDCSNGDTYSVLIIPGDIGSSLTRIELIFKHMVSQYDLVLYIVGNHEAWCGGTDVSYNSILKLRDVYKCAVKCGVTISPVKIISTNNEHMLGNGTHALRPVVIIPLSSWYHAGFDREVELFPEVQIQTQAPSDDQQRFLECWSDFHLCTWPTSIITKEAFVNIQHNVGSSTLQRGGDCCMHTEYQQGEMSNTDERALAFYFSKYNSNLLCKFGKRNFRSKSDGISNHLPSLTGSDAVSNTTPFVNCSKHAHANLPEFDINHELDYIITFSHFIPRNECTPEKRFLYNANLTKVIGSTYLEQQIRQIGSQMHLFGHSHIPIDIVLEGIRYIQWPLGYSREFKAQCSQIHQHGPLVVYNSSYHRTSLNHQNVDNHMNSTVPKLESERCHWSLHYKVHSRDPENRELASWVVEKKKDDQEKLKKMYANSNI